MKLFNADFKQLPKKLLRSGIPVAAIILICALLVLTASRGAEREFGNITAVRELADHSFEIIDETELLSGDYKAAYKNERFTLYINPQTSGLAVLDRKNGQTHYSLIPEGALEKANPHNADVRAYMLSNFVLTAVNPLTGATSEYTMYDQLQKDGKFSIEKIKDGLRITYLIGKIPETFTVPEALSEKRFKSICKALGEDGAGKFSNRYKTLDISQFFGTQRQEYLDKYPLCKDQTVYILNTDKTFIMRELQKLLLEIDYSEQDKANDEKEVMAKPTEQEIAAVFIIPIEFTLHSEGLSVAVDKEQIKYSSAAMPVSIEVCPYLISAEKQDEGYILLPDGSGSLMRLNGGAADAGSFSARIYGTDPLFQNNYDTEKILKAPLPVYGINSKEGGVFVHISKSEADATVKADAADKQSNLNNASVSFKLFGWKKEVVSQDWTTSGNGTVFTVRLQDSSMTGQAQVDYYFLPENKGTYAEMAAVYRGILLKNRAEADVKANSNPILLSVLGSYDSIRSVLGIPIQGETVMTTFSQAKKIAKDFYDSGIKIDLRYLAAVNGGYRQKLANKLSPVSSLEGSKGIKALTGLINENNGRVFWDVSLIKVYKNSLLDSFRFSRDSVAGINTKHTAFFEWDPVSFYYTKNSHYLLSPGKIGTVTESLTRSALKNNAKGLALRGVGEVLYSDCDSSEPYSRIQTQNELTSAAAKAKKTGAEFLYDAGNAYVLPTADYLTDLASAGNHFRSANESVPFYQMAVHGIIPYSYTTLNSESDGKSAVLFSVATGARLHYTVSWKNSSALKGTEYSEYYNTTWDVLKNTAIENALFTADAVAATYDRQFLSFEQISENVTRSVFSDGVTVIVNFGNEEYNHNGKAVAAGGYIVEREGDI